MGDNPVSLLDQFNQEMEVVYRGEAYRVRDNGAACRQPKAINQRIGIIEDFSDLVVSGVFERQTLN